MASSEPGVYAGPMVGVHAGQELDVFFILEILIANGAYLGAACTQRMVLDDRQVVDDNRWCGVLVGPWKDVGLYGCICTLYCRQRAKATECICCDNAQLPLLVELLLALPVLMRVVADEHYGYQRHQCEEDNKKNRHVEGPCKHTRQGPSASYATTELSTKTRLIEIKPNKNQCNTAQKAAMNSSCCAIAG